MKFIKYIISVINKGLEKNISVYAAQSTYYLILSSIPFIMIILSVVQLFIPLDKMVFAEVIPETISPGIRMFLNEITDEILAKPTLSLISFSAITTLWSASRGFSALERGIRVIYDIPKRKFFVADVLISLVYTIAFALVLILFFGVVVFGRAIIYLIEIHISRISININAVQYIFFFLLVAVFFSVVYSGLSSRKIPFRYQLPGAFFTIIGWGIFSFIFSIYVNNFSNYSRIYGSLTALILLMLWLYFCTTIFLYGAQINMEIIKYNKVKYLE